MFTYRDFEMGTLGLAWTGDLKNAGGVCEKNGVSANKMHLNLDSSKYYKFLLAKSRIYIKLNLFDI